MSGIGSQGGAPHQGRHATVGDTVWIATTVPLAPRQILRPQTWDIGDLGQVLGPPQVQFRADSAVIRYPVAFWYPGGHTVTVPGPIVVSPEGRSDTLPSRQVAVTVGSVLPAAANRDSLAPRDAAGLLPQTERSLLPLGFFWLLVLIVASLVAVWLVRSRRPGAPVPASVPPTPDLARLLDRWADAGETRTALDGWSHLVEQSVRERGGDAATLLATLETIGFQPAPPADEVERVIASAKAWLEKAR